MKKKILWKVFQESRTTALFYISLKIVHLLCPLLRILLRKLRRVQSKLAPLSPQALNSGFTTKKLSMARCLQLLETLMCSRLGGGVTLKHSPQNSFLTVVHTT